MLSLGFSDSRFWKSSEGKDKMSHMLSLLYAAWKIDKDHFYYIARDTELMPENSTNLGAGEYSVNSFMDTSFKEMVS